MSKITEGSKAPDFTLPSSEGGEVSLSDFKGKQNVVLYFYPKDNTLGCTKEVCDFRDMSKKFQKKDTVVLGISADSLKAHDNFKSKYKLSFPLLSDENKEVIKKYGVWQEKSLYGKKFMGIVRSTFVINKEGKIAKIFPKVKVDGHVEAVLEGL